MEILSSTKVVVFNSSELKSALEEANKYNYIYFGDNITLESTITINESKNKVIIDGTYLNQRYTYTGMVSSEKANVITASSTNKKIIVKNIDIINAHDYGVIYVPANTIYRDVVTEYNNVKFNGTELAYNPYGTARMIDCNITMETTASLLAQEVCEAKHVEIGGNTTITSNSVNYSLFSFFNNVSKPTMTFLPFSRVNLSTDTKELMSGTNQLNFTLMHDAEVNLVTGNGFGAFTIHGALDVLIDERATLNFIENKHQRIPMWTVYGNFTMNEGSNLFVINTYDNTPTDNYNIHFKGTNQKLILNNPNSVIIYTKNANVLYTNNSLDFSFDFSRLNMWTDALDFSAAGDINNLPKYSWYKDNGLSSISGNIIGTETTISSNNFTASELTAISDLTNFSFENKKQFSIGTTYMNIHPIDSTSTSITGHIAAFADLLITYKDTSDVVTADENGFFEYQLLEVMDDDTKINITSNVASSFVYKTRIITTPHSGELTLASTSNNVVFDLEPVSLVPLVLPKKEETTVKIIDSRSQSSAWKLYVHIVHPLVSANGFQLNNALIFKKFDNTSVILNEVPSLVLTGTDNGGSAEAYDITWSKNQGLLLNLDNDFLEVNEEYNTKVIWSIEE